MGLAQATTDGLSAYEGLHFWGLAPEVFGIVVAAAGLAAFIALPLARPLSQAVGKRRAMVALYLAWLVTVAAPPMLRLAEFFPANGSPALVPLLTVNFLVGATCVLTALIIQGSMLTDAIDAVAVRTGLRAEGLTFAVFGVLSKWAIGAGAFVAGAIVSLVAFPVRAEPGAVDMAILNQMVMIRVPFVVVLNLTAIFLLSRLATPATAQEPAAPLREAA